MQWKIIWGHVGDQLWVLAEAYYEYTIPYYMLKLVQKHSSGTVSQVMNLPVF